MYLLSGHWWWHSSPLCCAGSEEWVCSHLVGSWCRSDKSQLQTVHTNPRSSQSWILTVSWYYVPYSKAETFTKFIVWVTQCHPQKVFSMIFGHATPTYTIGSPFQWFHESFSHKILVSYWSMKVFLPCTLKNLRSFLLDIHYKCQSLYLLYM